MLNAKLYTLGITYGIGTEPNLVTVGVVIEETDTSLQHRYISARLDWGDSSNPYIIEPRLSPFNAAAYASITRQSFIAYLSLDPAPYTGTFSLYYGVTPLQTLIPNIPYDVTAANLQALVNTIISPGDSVKVSGDTPLWKLTFNSEPAASKLSAGSNDLYAPAPIQKHPYPNGNFLLELTATNYRSPNSDEVTATMQISIAQEEAIKLKAPVVIGPVLASDTGYPNPAQWNFNTATDLQVLVSSIKMILIVEPGERLMMPEYGCALRRYIFDPLDGATDQDIQAEIRRAIDTWEPRVTVQAVDFIRNQQERSISVTVTLISLLNQERFQLNVELER